MLARCSEKNEATASVASIVRMTVKELMRDNIY